jgi:hypothetical protein
VKRLAAVLLLLGAQSVLAQDQLGRLFFTPEQRDGLDARRRARVPDKPAAPVVASPTTRFGGYVQRSGGNSTVFVDGQALPEGSAEAPRVDTGRADGRVPITIGEGTRFPLKPGEVLDRGTGDVRDVLGEGEIRVRRSP